MADEADRRGDAQHSFKHIVRVANTDLKGEKRLLYALTKIKGVSVMFANAVLSVAGIDKQKRAGELSEEEVKALNDIISDPLKFSIPSWLLNRRKDYDSGKDLHLLHGSLDFTREMDIKRLKKLKSYRGLRHQWGLPVRGQRTKSNFRKNKGKALGVKRKK